MRRLARRTPVLYVEAPLTWVSLIRHPRRVLRDPLRRAHCRRAFVSDERSPEPGLVLHTPITAVPRHLLYSWAIGRFGDVLARAQDRAWSAGVKRRVRQLGFSRPLLWFVEPTAPGLLDLPDSTLVYDCVDRWLGFPGPCRHTRWHKRLATDEGSLLDRAAAVFCSSRGLLEANSRRANGQVVLLRNGADVRHFASAMDPATPAAAELKGLGRPVIGYVGAVAGWMDFALVRGLAMKRPDWSIVLVGPSFEGAVSGEAADAELIAGLPNVHLLGHRDYMALPRYLRGFDVAIIPFKVNGLTEDTNPIKVYEYLAAGIPVVSTPLPEVTALPGVRTASGTAEFILQIEGALRDKNDPALRRQRIDTATENSWDARVETAWQALLGLRASGTGADPDG